MTPVLSYLEMNLEGDALETSPSWGYVLPCPPEPPLTRIKDYHYIDVAVLAEKMTVRLPDDHWGTRSISCYEKVEQIGEGTYGQVREGDLKIAVRDLRLTTSGFPTKLRCPALVPCC